jgi:hypothetical protein
MRWPFRLRSDRDVPGAESTDQAVLRAVDPPSGPRTWARGPKLATIIRLRAPILSPFLTGPDIAGSRELLETAGGRDGPGDLGGRQTGVIVGLATVRRSAGLSWSPSQSELKLRRRRRRWALRWVGPDPDLPEQPALSSEQPGQTPAQLELSPEEPGLRPEQPELLPEQPAVRRRQPPVLAKRRPRPALTSVTPESVGAPVEPDRPFRSIGEFERMLAEMEADDAVGLAMLTGFSSSAAPPPTPVVPPPPQQSVRRLPRRTLAETRKRATSPLAPEPPAESAVEQQAVEASIEPTGEPVPDDPGYIEPSAGLDFDQPAQGEPEFAELQGAMPVWDEPRPAVAGADKAQSADPGADGPRPREPEFVAEEHVTGYELSAGKPRPLLHAANPSPVEDPIPQLREATQQGRRQLSDPAHPSGRKLSSEPTYPSEPGAHFTSASRPATLLYRSSLIATASPVSLLQEDRREADVVVVRVPGEVAGPVAARFGVTVDDVPVLRGPSVGVRAGAMSARAFSSEGAVYLPDEAGDLTEPGTQALLAHELVHVGQQQALGQEVPPADSWAGQRLEDAAVQTEQWFRTQSDSSTPLIHRRTSAQELHAPNAQVQRAPVEMMPLVEPGAGGGGVDWASSADEPLPDRYDLQQQAELPIGQPGSSAPGLPVSGFEWRITREPAGPRPGTDPAVLDRLGRLEDEVGQLQEDRSGDPAALFVGLEDPRLLSRLAERLYANFRHRLRGELLIDRERHGALADLS